MNLQDALNIVIVPGLKLLHPNMDSRPARAMLLTIGQQEGDRFTARRQYQDGPARSFYQFERGGGVAGVLQHRATKNIISNVLDRLQYNDHSPEYCHAAIEHNDALATVFARLLLYTLPAELPERGEHMYSWSQYLSAWRPGHPRRDKWDEYYDLAWAAV